MAFYVDISALNNVADEMEGIGAIARACNAEKASATTRVPAPGADSVSVMLSQFFSNHGLQYQAQAAQGMDLHQDFVRSVKNAGRDYTDAETENSSTFK